MKKERPLSFKISSHGGFREGAGRKRQNEIELPHVAREKIDARTPMHITLKMCAEVPGIRTPQFLNSFTAGVERAKSKGLRVQQFSIQEDHIHLVAECDDNDALTKGLASLSASIVWALRKVFGFFGRVFASRFHMNAIRVPRLMRNTLRYVLTNRHHHTGDEFGDVYSTIYSFDAIEELIGTQLQGCRPRWQGGLEACLTPARSWMQNVGWKRARGV